MIVQTPSVEVEDGCMVSNVISLVQATNLDGHTTVYLAGAAGASGAEGMTLDHTMILGILEQAKLMYFTYHTPPPHGV